MTYASHENQKKRIDWIFSLSGLLISLLLTYLTVCQLSKCGVDGVIKTLKYGFSTKDDRKNYSDYLTWYKQRKMNESWGFKKFGSQLSDFTYEKIVEREAKEKKEKIKRRSGNFFGEVGGKFDNLGRQAGLEVILLKEWEED